MISYQNNQLYIEQVPAAKLAEEYGTPLYVYSQSKLLQQCGAYAKLQAPFPVSSHYAVKANPNLALLRLIHQAGLGFDVVSGGELHRCLRIGAKASQIVYSGVGKSTSELLQAMEAGVCINIESDEECQRIISLAERQSNKVRLAIRVNPDIAVATHPYIATAMATSKFGVPLQLVPGMANKLAKSPQCELVGVACHLGSMIETVEPYVEACRQLVKLVKDISALADIQHISLGGGLAVCYQNEREVQPRQMINEITPVLENTGLHLMLEPGRSIVAECGITLSRVEYIKQSPEKHFAIVDAAMNDLPRPSLYKAWHDIQPVIRQQGESKKYDVVGPVCESGDFIGHDRDLAVHSGDLLAVMTTGAYSASMASNYNCRMRAASVLVDGTSHRCIARRENMMDNLAAEEDVWKK